MEGDQPTTSDESSRTTETPDDEDEVEGHTGRIYLADGDPLNDVQGHGSHFTGHSTDDTNDVEGHSGHIGG